MHRQNAAKLAGHYARKVHNNGTHASTTLEGTCRCIIFLLVFLPGAFHLLATGGYAPLNADDVTYTSPFHPDIHLGASNPTMETSKSTTAL